MKLSVANTPLLARAWDSQAQRARALDALFRSAPPGPPRPPTPAVAPAIVHRPTPSGDAAEPVVCTTARPRCALVKLGPRAPERDDVDVCPMPVGDGGAW